MRSSLTVIALLAMLALPLSASEPAVPVRLPDKVLLHVATGPFDDAIGDIDQFFSTLTGRLPLDTGYQPGLLKVMTGILLPIPPAARTDDPMHFVLVQPNGEKLYPGLLMPIKDYQTAVDALKTGGIELEASANSMKLDVQNADVYIAEYGKSHMLLAASDDQIKELKAILGAWVPTPPPSGVTLSATADVANIVAENRQAFTEAIQSAESSFANTQKKALDGLDGNRLEKAKRLYTWLSAKIKPLLTRTVDTLAVVRWDFVMNADGLRVGMFAAPKETSSLLRVANALSSAGRPEFDYVKALPENCIQFVAYANLQVLADEYRVPVAELVKDFARDAAPERATEFAKLIDSAMNRKFGDVVQANLLKDDETFYQVAYIANPPTETELDAQIKIAGMVFDFLHELGLPFKLDFKAEAKAGSARGADYARYSIAVSDQPPELSAEVKQAITAIEAYNVLSTAVGQTEVTVAYPGGEAELSAAIAGLKEKKGALLAKEEVDAVFSSRRHAELAFSMGYPDIFLVSYLRQIVEGMPEDDPARDELEFALSDLEPGRHPMSVSVGAIAGALAAEANLPMESLSSIVASGAMIWLTLGEPERHFIDEVGPVDDSENYDDNEGDYDPENGVGRQATEAGDGGSNPSN